MPANAFHSVASRSNTYPEENVSARIEAGRIDAGVLRLRAIDDDAAGEARDGRLHHFGVLLVAGQRVHDDEVNGRLGGAADLRRRGIAVGKW